MTPSDTRPRRSDKPGRAFPGARPGWPWIVLTALSLLLAVPAVAATQSVLDERLFPVPEELEPNVAFWTKVYSEYDDDRVLLHDEPHLQVIYTVLNFSAVEASGKSRTEKARIRRREIRKTEAKYQVILSDLAAGRVSKDHPEDQKRVERLFATVPGGRSKYSAASHRLRTQTCLKNRFAEAIERSGVYMPRIEKIFRDRGLPVTLTRLPFVESLFQWHARSSASAVGIWQFVSGTARAYLDMEIEYDERLDPLLASHAAARYLESNYKSLETWPLAITAYNHGANGMRRAVRRLGTRDLGTITSKYRSRTFGFASRNFYAEFIAAARVYADRETLFPGVHPRPELRFDEFEPALYVALRDLAREAGTELAVLREMNPAVSSQVWNGHLYLPKSYALRVPAGTAPAFEQAFAALPDQRKAVHQVGFRYQVRRGDTLSKIAAKFGSSAPAIQHANKLSSPHRIRVGQRLLIPPGGRGAPRVAAASSSSSSTAATAVHMVRRGETLSTIAAKYGTTVRAIMNRNSLGSAHRIYVGQRLHIGGSANGNGERTHVVRQGENLTAIARRYGTSVRAIRDANGLNGHTIHPNQKLRIP